MAYSHVLVANSACRTHPWLSRVGALMSSYMKVQRRLGNSDGPETMAFQQIGVCDF